MEIDITVKGEVRKRGELKREVGSQGSTQTVAQLPGATGFRCGQVKNYRQWHLGNSFNLQHFKFQQPSQQTTHVSGKSVDDKF